MHTGALQTPAPLQARAQGEPVFCQAPLESQVWGCSGPLHCVCPTAHTPVQLPPTQVWLLHSAPTTQLPELLHVSGSFFVVQPVEPEAQTPVHAPPTHVVPLHA
jgi:hypothetical protein